MKAEVLHTQRHLTGLRLRMADGELLTKYVFPFVAEDWSVPFAVVDAMTLGPRIFQGPLVLESGALQTKEPTAKLEPVSSVPLARFETVVHFDPWWAFRGIGGVPRDWVRAILAANLAGTFFHEGTTYKLHDFEFSPGLDRLEAVVGKDPVFKTVRFHRGDLDLLLLRHPAAK